MLGVLVRSESRCLSPKSIPNANAKIIKKKKNYQQQNEFWELISNTTWKSHNVNLKKECICQGLLLVKWKQIHNRVATANRSLSHTLHFRIKLQSETSAYCIVFLRSINPYKGLPGIILSTMHWDLSHPTKTVQLYPHLHLYSPLQSCSK